MTKFLWWGLIFCFPTLCCCNFVANISWNQFFTKELYFKLISRKKLAVNFQFSTLCSYFNTVWKLRNFAATILSQKFRESNVFTKELYSELIWRKKKLTWQWISSFSKLCSTQYGNCETLLPPWFCRKNSVKSPFFTKELYSKLIWRKSFYMAENFSFLHTVFNAKIKIIL